MLYVILDSRENELLEINFQVLFKMKSNIFAIVAFSPKRETKKVTKASEIEELKRICSQQQQKICELQKKLKDTEKKYERANRKFYFSNAPKTNGEIPAKRLERFTFSLLL